MQVVEEVDLPISVAVMNLRATEKSSDEGTTSLADLQKNGMSQNEAIRSRGTSKHRQSSRLESTSRMGLLGPGF